MFNINTLGFAFSSVFHNLLFVVRRIVLSYTHVVIILAIVCLVFSLLYFALFPIYLGSITHNGNQIRGHAGADAATV